MGIVSSGALYDVLRQYSLVSRDCLAELPKLVQNRCGDARALVKLLIRRGWLTLYQAKEILYGNGGDLVLGPYHILDVLGRGGLSEVYKARHAEHGWIVALKILRPEALSDDAGRRQFLQEMEAMACMEHANVAQFCDLDQAGDTFYFAMEFIEGVDLDKHVSLSGPLPVPEACEYIRQAALGLQHAHEHNLVHRDIKPANLYLTRAPIIDTGRLGPRQPVATRPLIKLLDWGLADWRLPGERQRDRAEQEEGIVGTADYLSPEQARDPAGVDIRGDLYSLGCTFYYLLTGQPPFPQGNLAMKLMMHQTAEPACVDEFRQDVPIGAAAILQRMMAKQPEDRFQTPAAAAMALRPFTKNDAPLTPPLRVKQTRLGQRNNDTPLPAALERLEPRGPSLLPARQGA